MFFSQRALCNREEVHSQGDRGGICCKVFFKVIFIIIIIITRPKPAYGRQGLVGSWGQDTDKVSNFWVFLTAHFAQLGIKPTWDHS